MAKHTKKVGKLYNWVNIYNKHKQERQISLIYKDFD